MSVQTPRLFPPSLPRLALQLHPFDTEEGRAALTSPFAAGAFQTAIDVQDGSSADQQAAAAAVAAAAALGAAASRGSRESRPSKYHDSAGTASGSSLSGGSHRSWMAKCARIETKSLPHSGLPESALAPAGVPAGVAAGRRGGRSSLEMQPMGRPSPAVQSSRASGPSTAAAAEAAALAAEEEDVVAAMLAGEGGRPFSSEGVRALRGWSGVVGRLGGVCLSRCVAWLHARACLCMLCPSARLSHQLSAAPSPCASPCPPTLSAPTEEHRGQQQLYPPPRARAAVLRLGGLARWWVGQAG